MLRSGDTKSEGTTTFSAPLARRYRYAIELKGNLLSIWLEDLSRKQQWYSYVPCVLEYRLRFLIHVVYMLPLQEHQGYDSIRLRDKRQYNSWRIADRLFPGKV